MLHFQEVARPSCMSEPLSVPVLARMLAASEWDERQRALRTLAHAGAQLTPELITPLLVRPALAAASAHGPSQSLCPSASRLPLAPAVPRPPNPLALLALPHPC